MKAEKPMRAEDVELEPDAMERLERAIKHAAKHAPVRHPTKAKPSKAKRPTRRP